MKLSLTHFKFSIACLFLAVTLCLSPPAHAAGNDYALLVQRNLELREKIGVLEQKYTELENERGVLIGHVRNLQREKERLVNARGNPPGEASSSGGPAVDESRYARIETVVREVSDQLSAVTEEKAGLEKELAKTKEILGEGQAKAKTLEQENSALNKELKNIKEELAARPAGFLPEEKAAKNRMMADEEPPRTEPADSLGSEKDTAIERAFSRAREMELRDRERTISAESDRLKADVQRLAGANAALKDTGRKLRQAKQDLVAARAGSREIEAKNRKLENKLAGMDVLKTRSRKNEAFKGAAPFYPGARKDTMALSPANKQRLDMHFNLAVAYDKTKMYQAEEREYMECLRLDPNDASAHYNLGILYDDKLKDDAKAIKHYQKYLRLRPMGEDSEQVKEWILHAEQQQRL